jgi:hypothetical protein
VLAHTTKFAHLARHAETDQEMLLHWIKNLRGMMAHWRDELNRIATEFWCGVGLMEELPVVADAANADLGEAHSDIWNFYTCSAEEDAAALTLKLAWELNRFVPASWEAMPYAQAALKRALDNFFIKKTSVQSLCSLVNNLDTTFNVYLRHQLNSPPLIESEKWWMGNLWNNCDWCDDRWTYENCPALVEEAHRVATMLQVLSYSRAG